MDFGLSLKELRYSKTEKKVTGICNTSDVFFSDVCICTVYVTHLMCVFSFIIAVLDLLEAM